MEIELRADIVPMTAENVPLYLFRFRVVLILLGEYKQTSLRDLNSSYNKLPHVPTLQFRCLCTGEKGDGKPEKPGKGGKVKYLP